MTKFDRFADWIADRWASAPWFVICVSFVFGWLSMGPLAGWNNDRWHLWLNSPTTALSFLGIFLLHNVQSRYERAANKRWRAIFERLEIDDPSDDPGQKPA